MNRPQTDFLCAASSFLMGMGSILNLSGQHHAYNTCENPDAIAVANDWRMSGQDIGDALQKAKDENLKSPTVDHERNKSG